MVAGVTVSVSAHLPSVLQGVSDELRSLGLPRFTKRYPRRTADDVLLRLGNFAVWSTSIDAAIIARYGAHSTALGSQPDTNELLNEHGIDPRELAHPKLPEVGDQFLRRGDIQRVYGGNSVAGIACFRDDDVVNCFSDDESGSYADDPPTPLESVKVARAISRSSVETGSWSGLAQASQQSASGTGQRAVPSPSFSGARLWVAIGREASTTKSGTAKKSSGSSTRCPIR
jgi:hypothetical protein